MTYPFNKFISKTTRKVLLSTSSILNKLFNKLYPHQFQVYDKAFSTSPTTTEVISVLSPRQRGKTFLIIAIVIRFLITSHFAHAIVIEPSYEQSNRVLRQIKRACPFFSYNLGSNEVSFSTTNSSVVFRSAGQTDRLRGDTASGENSFVICDEAAFIKDSIYGIILPMLAKHRANLILFSTPLWAKGTFYDACTSKDPNYFHFNWSEYEKDNFDYWHDFITPEQLETYKSLMSPQQFSAEFLGEWLHETSMLFGNLSDYFVPANYTYSNVITIGIDWAYGAPVTKDNPFGSDNDFTTVIALDANGCMLPDFLHANHGTSIQQATAVASFIISLQKKGYQINIIRSEANALGDPLTQLLKDQLPPELSYKILPVAIDNNEKVSMITNLQTSLIAGLIKIQPINTLTDEMSVYRMERTPSGGTTFNAPPGYHDDCVMALAHTSSALLSSYGQYHIH